MTVTDTTSASTTTKAAKPTVFDARGENPTSGQATPVELGFRVKIQTGADKDNDAAGKPLVGTITGIEYQRARVVVKVDGVEKLIVRPASKVFVIKNSSGKIERVERAVRAGKVAKADAPASDTAPAPQA